IAVAVVPSVRKMAITAGAQLANGAAYQAAVLGVLTPPSATIPDVQASLPAKPPDTHPLHGIETSLMAIGLMALLLSDGRWRKSRLLHALRKPAIRLRSLHNGHVPDYVAWLLVG